MPRPLFVASHIGRWHMSIMSSTPTEQAEALAHRGEATAAARVLDAAGHAGDADAAFMLALWCLTGQQIVRNLAAARYWFGVSGELGRLDAANVCASFLASGVGGPRNWPGALAGLVTLSRSQADAARQLALIGAMQIDAVGDPTNPPVGEAIGSPLPITRFPGFCTAEECAFIADAAAPLFEPANVVDPRTGAPVRNLVRTSDTAAFPFVDESPALHAINRRIASVSRTLPEQGEPLQVLRYRPGQEYRPHIDALPGAVNQRIATMLIYLNDGYEGGQSHFLHTGFSVEVKAGDAILFQNCRDGAPDMAMLHAGLPVRRGTKLIASRWIRARPFFG